MKVSSWQATLPPGQKRERELATAFRRAYGDRSVSGWRAPGRVNLIGEHTDYNNLPVLPMAIPFDIAILFSASRERGVRLENTSKDFGPRSFAVEEEIAAYEPGDWGNYAKAAVQGLISHLGWDSREWVGFDAVVDGTIPKAAGLSSSSALVVAFALAFAGSNGIAPRREELADELAAAEWYVGTRGGGMDQAVCLLAKEGNALLIHFFPVRTEPVSIPGEAVFVVCDSLVAAPKSREARGAYNLRALECRLAAGILARRLGAAAGEGGRLPRLGDLLTPGGGSPEELVAVLEGISGGSPWTRERVAGALGLTVEELEKEWFEAFATEVDARRPLRILERARHVLSEAGRVYGACAALRSGDLSAFGASMNASHESCAGDFEISTPELDRLVEAARRHGALGSRLTGAGFGGCTVSLVPAGRVEAFRRGVAEDYYGSGGGSGVEEGGGGSGGEGFPIYVCRPVEGASRLV